MAVIMHDAQHLRDSRFAGLAVRLRLASVLLDLFKRDTPRPGARLHYLLRALLGLLPCAPRHSWLASALHTLWSAAAPLQAYVDDM